MSATPDVRRRVAVALLASAVVVFGAPVAGAVRASVFAAVPGRYVLVVSAIVAVLAVGLVGAALATIRDRRGPRVALVGTALLLAVTVLAIVRTGNANVDAVEAFHVVEYGVLAVLFARIWRGAGRATALVAPALATTTVAVLDEWYQWFVPDRAGEMRDVWLNVAAAVCGLLVSAAVWPPEPVPSQRDEAARLAWGAAGVTLVAAAFFATAHVGHVIRTPAIGSFVSIETADGLLAAAADRTRRWRDGVPAVARTGREDQYLSEGLWHVRRRNDAYADDDPTTAWGENAILETYYAPVLALRDASSPTGHRWPPEQRADVEARRRHTASFTSDAHPYPIHPWPKGLYWTVIAGLCAVGVGAARAADRRRRRIA